MGRVRIVSLGGREDGWLLPDTIAAWVDEAGYCTVFEPHFHANPCWKLLYSNNGDLILHTSKFSAPVIINKPTVLKVVKARTRRPGIAQQLRRNITSNTNNKRTPFLQALNSLHQNL